MINDQLGAGTEVWVFGGYAALPTRGTVRAVLTDGGRPAWGYRVSTGTRGEPEDGRIFCAHAVFLRPQQRERLIRSLMDQYDALSSAADKLANEQME